MLVRIISTPHDPATRVRVRVHVRVHARGRGVGAGCWELGAGCWVLAGSLIWVHKMHSPSATANRRIAVGCANLASKLLVDLHKV